MSPIGFRFRPSVNELIDVLEIMAHGGDNIDVSQLTETPGDISNKQLYGEVDKEPWKLLWNDNEWELYDVADTGKKKATYVVTRLPKMGGNKVARKAGNGTWMGQTQPTVFEKDGEEVACMKSLSYVYTGPSSEAEDNCYYYLHEYYLSKTYLEKIGAKFTDYVICRIIKDTSKRCRRGRNATNKRRRVKDFTTSYQAKNEEGNYNSSLNSETTPSLQETLVQHETLIHQEPLVYYHYPEFTGNPSSFGLGANDHNLEPPPYNYYNSEFTENRNPSGLWVDGYTPQTQPYYGSTITELQQQHYQDSSGKPVAQEPPSLYEGGISLNDVTNYYQDYEGGLALEDIDLTWDEEADIFGEPQQEYCSNAAPAMVTEYGDTTDEESISYMNQFLANDATELGVEMSESGSSQKPQTLVQELS